MRKTVSFLLAVLMLTTLFSPLALAEEETYSMMVPLWYTEAPTSETQTIKEMEKIAGAKLDFIWVPSDAYQEKVNVTIASNDLPNVITILNPKHSVYVQAARAGMFWDLTDKLKNYEFFTRTDPLIVSNAKLDGKNYYVPRTRMLARKAVVFRQDWLDKLGLQPPTTMEEIYEVAKAFTFNDPDGNGKNDTYGLMTAYNPTQGVMWGLSQAVVWMGGGLNYIVDENDKLVPTFMTKEYMDTLDWYRKMYAEGIINQDFATIAQEKSFELMNAGQGGMCLAQSDEVENRFNALVKLKASETGRTDMQVLDVIGWYSKVKTPAGEIRTEGGSGFFGGYAIPKSSVRTEEELDKLLAVLDKLDTPAAQDIIQWGIEGIHHTMQDGIPVLNEDQQAWTTDCCTLQQVSATNITAMLYRQGKRSPVQAAYIADQIENAQYAVGDPTVPLISDTSAIKGPELAVIIGDATVKYIMGQLDKAGFEAAIERWKAAGGTKVIEEMNVGYQLSLGK